MCAKQQCKCPYIVDDLGLTTQLPMHGLSKCGEHAHTQHIALASCLNAWPELELRVSALTQELADVRKEAAQLRLEAATQAAHAAQLRALRPVCGKLLGISYTRSGILQGCIPIIYM
jgi:hypothetical protein